MSSSAPYQPVATASNAFGMALYQRLAGQGGNLCVSPYSIHSALALLYAGARSETKSEMRQALHLCGNDAELHGSYKALRERFETLTEQNRADQEEAADWSDYGDTIELLVANRLFGKLGYPFSSEYLSCIEEFYAAEIERVDFSQSESARERINDWVAEQTGGRISDMIESGVVDSASRLILVNALYFKAAWAAPFLEQDTAQRPFALSDSESCDVDTLYSRAYYGYSRDENCTVVTVPYSGKELQFLILVPHREVQLEALEQWLTAEWLQSNSSLPESELELFLPKFSLSSPPISLTEELKQLGMARAFDMPAGSADFSGMISGVHDEYLVLSEVLHKTFLDVNELGTEAASATALFSLAGMPPPQSKKPITVRVDRPFLYAVQERFSGVCLFLGRVVDPR